MFSAFIQRKFFLFSLFVFLLLFLSSSVFAQNENSQQDPVKIFNQGQDAHEKGDLKTALKLYEEAIKISPEFPEAEYQRGIVLTALGNPSEAEKAFRRAIELRENWPLPMTSLGSLLISTDRYPEAETFLVRAIELDEQNVEAYSALADLRLRTKASAEVLKDLLGKIQTLSSKNNSTAGFLASQGAIQRALGDKASAKSNLDKALTIAPNNSFALSERIELYLSANNFQSALEDAKKLVGISPNSNTARLLLARIYAQSGNAAEALKILDGMDQSDSEVGSLKNTIMAAGGEDIPALEKMLEKDSKNASLLGRLCSLSRTSNPQKALEYCRRAADAEPGNINHAVGFGAALVQAKQFENAVAVLRRIVQVAPDNYPAHANLATALFQLKLYPEAAVEYAWIAKNKTDAAIAYYFLAISLDQMGEYAQALANYQEFLKHADASQNQLEIDKVNLRLPAVQKLAKQKGKN